MLDFIKQTEEQVLRLLSYREGSPSPSCLIQNSFFGTLLKVETVETDVFWSGITMTKDDDFHTPRCRSDGKKGKGKEHSNKNGIYSAKHVRLSLAVAASAVAKNKK